MSSRIGWPGIAAVATIGVIGVGVYLVGASDAEPSARRVLEAQGITVTQLGGYDFFACVKDDSYSVHFEGVGPTGKPVGGTVCSGPLKGSTVRYR